MMRLLICSLSAMMAAQGLAFGGEPEPAEGRLPRAFPSLPSWRGKEPWQAQAAAARGPGLIRQRGRGAEGSRPRARLYLSAALALGGGGLALWSKRRADEAYESYLRSAGIRRREKQFERAERYDRIAGAAFAAMEAGIVLTTYFVFFSHGTQVDIHLLPAPGGRRLR